MSSRSFDCLTVQLLDSIDTTLDQPALWNSRLGNSQYYLFAKGRAGTLCNRHMDEPISKSSNHEVVDRPR